MARTAESEARRALNRMRRAVEKAQRELAVLSGALRHAEGSDFPTDAYQEAERRMVDLLEFTTTEASRLQVKILEAGGLEPGRIRRSSGD